MTQRLVAVLRALVFIAVALVLCGVIFQFAGYSAPSMFASIVDGAFLRPGAALQSLRWALPLFITSVGVSISFRCGYFNIGAQGQFYVGAISATFMAAWLNGAPRNVFCTITADNEQGGALAGEYLRSLGHQRIAHLSGPRRHGNMTGRTAGFVRSLAAGSRPIEPIGALRIEQFRRRRGTSTCVSCWPRIPTLPPSSPPTTSWPSA